MRTPPTATEVTLVLPASRRGLAAARAAVRELEGDLAGHVAEVELLVSELVTNAFRHSSGATSTVRFTVTCNADRVHVEVVDGGRGFVPPAAPAPGEESGSGWGLQLLDTLASSWGVRADPRTTVWFELELRAPERVAA